MADADPKVPRRWTKRPLFSPNQMLTAEQLNLMMEEEHSRSQKSLRALHGNGVIFGFATTRGDGPDPLNVSCGMALDRHGRLLHWPGGAVTKADLVAMPECADTFTLSVHYARREVPGNGCGPCSDRPQWIEEGVVFSLKEGCGPRDRTCPRPADDACCIDLDEYVCLRNGAHDGPLPPAVDLEWACSREGPLCRIGCSDISYDADAGIPIACVDIKNLCDHPDCTPVWGFGAVEDTCDVRPWVYRTPLLYELIEGCQNDLARVASVQWGTVASDANEWPPDIAWDVFAAAIKQGPEIAFTRKVRIDTVHPGSTFMTAILWEREDDYLLTRRVPALVRALDADGDYATRFQLQVNPGWISNEIDSRSELKSGGRIELTIRGQMIRDCCDNMLDALPLDYAPRTPPLSRPGGDFVTVLRFDEEARTPSPPPEPGQTPPPSDQDY